MVVVNVEVIWGGGNTSMWPFRALGKPTNHANTVIIALSHPLLERNTQCASSTWARLGTRLYIDMTMREQLVVWGTVGVSTGHGVCEGKRCICVRIA